MPPDGCPDPLRHIAAAPSAPHSAPAPVAVPAVGVGQLRPAPAARGPEVLPLSSSGKRTPKRLPRLLHPPDARSCSGKSYRPLRHGSWIDKYKWAIGSPSEHGFVLPSCGRRSHNKRSPAIGRSLLEPRRAFPRQTSSDAIAHSSSHTPPNCDSPRAQHRSSPAILPPDPDCV